MAKKALMEPAPALASLSTELAGQLATLALDQIELDPNTDVRTGPKSRDEAEKVDHLARSLYADGQLQPILVRPNGADGKYLLIAGRRRLQAKHIIAAKTGEAQTIDAMIVKRTDEQAWASSIQENLQRKQFSPIELAVNIFEIKKRKNFGGDNWSKHVADFLHMSRATVTQHAKLLELSADIKAKVHQGLLSAQSAFDLHSVEEGKRSQVLAQAELLAAEEAKEEAPAKSGRTSRSSKASENEPTPQSASKNGTSDGAGKGKIKRKHILEAARQAESLTQFKARTRIEILEFFAQIIDSTDPYPEPIVDFCKTLANRWATGQVGDRALLNKLDAMAELCADKKPKKKAS